MSYVFRPTGESVPGEKAVWGMVKGDMEAYTRIRGDASLEAEEENQLDARALKLIPVVGYEEDVVIMDDEMDVKEEGGEGAGAREVLLSD